MSSTAEYPHRIFISFPFSNRNAAQIPVPPETISGGTASIVSTYNLITIGEVLAQGGVKLERVKWESHFPKIYDSSISVITEEEHRNPLAWRDSFVSIQKKQTFVNVAIANTPIDMRMGVVGFKWAFVPGPSGDIWYQLDLIEDKQGQIREFDGIKFPEASDRESPSTVQESLLPGTTGFDIKDFRPGDAISYKLYRVQQGDTLADISAAVFGSGRHWQIILDANKDLLLGTVIHVRVPPVISPASVLPLSLERQREAGLLTTRYVGGIVPYDWILADPILRKDQVLPVILYIPYEGLFPGTPNFFDPSSLVPGF